MRCFKILYFLSVIFCISCSLFSQDIRYPNIPIYENKELVPHKIQNKDYKKFKKLTRKYFFSMPETSYKGKNFSVYLLDKREMKILEKSNLEYEIFPKSAPFKYYDIGYDTRAKKKFTNLEDLKLGYKNERINKVYLQVLAEKFPKQVKYFELGETRLGRVIPAIQITSSKPSEYKIPILFTGAHHANELISTEHCYDIILNLLDDFEKYEPYLENISVWIVPIVNPDGSHFFWNQSVDMGRKNGYLPPEMKEDDPTRGVDLNRNYPFRWNSGNRRASSGNTNNVFYRGPSPASEPETKAMIELAKRERFLFAMSFHSFATAILFPYTIDNLTNPEPDYVKDLAGRIISFAKSVRLNKEYRILKNLYPVDGTDQDYYYHTFGTNAFIAESSHQNVDYKIVHGILKGFKGVWENLLYEFFKGNKVILKIANNEGKPLSARVVTEEIIQFEKEVYTSNPVTGIYAKMFLEEKEYTFLISKKGYEEQKVILKAGKSLKPNLVKLQKL
ncbi:MAG: peptidase M14 [Leptospiraceae bacterium]|nr:peptidase M14 [Leptospiraceae bacterium]